MVGVLGSLWKISMEIQTQELIEVKEHVTTVQDVANALLVNSPESMAQATDALHRVGQAEKFIAFKKEGITRPLMQSLASVRDLFKPLETNLAEAKRIIKGKMISWQTEEDARIQKEKDRITKRVEKGTMKPETAAGKLEKVGDAPVSTKGDVGKATIREVKKVRVADEALIPREYLVPNMTLITESVLRKGLTISGIELYIEKVVVSR